MTDLLRDIAKKDDLFGFVLDFVDGLPRECNTVDAALGMLDESRPITVSGDIVAIPEPVPVQITKKDYEEGRAQSLLNKVHFFFDLAGDGGSLTCVVHNVTDLSEYPYGKTNDEFSRVIERLQDAYRFGKHVHVTGRYVTIMSARRKRRVLYADTVNIANDALMSHMNDVQFEKFMELCGKADIAPLPLFMDKAFMFYNADEYLKKVVALFSLTPRCREDMMHVLLLSRPGEGQDYLVDKVIQPMVRCGRVDGDMVTTTAALVGAMKSDESLGVGLLHKFNNERLVASELQMWNSAKMAALLGAMSEGKITVSKGKMNDVERSACENVMILGNIPNNWEPGMSSLIKFDALLCGKNKQYGKQMLSRLSLVVMRSSSKPDTMLLAKKMFENMDSHAVDIDTLFGNDDVLKGIYSKVDIPNRDIARMIRERKAEIMWNAGRTDADISIRLALDVWHRFFGQYFKYVSLLDVKVAPVTDEIMATLKTLAENDGFRRLLCNETGDLDARKIEQFGNMCRSVAKIQGHKKIMSADIKEASGLFVESMTAMVDESMNIDDKLENLIGIE